MAKTSLIFFKKDCMGCHACEVACKQEHGLGVGPRLVRIVEKSPDYIPVYCHHCAKAPCVQACPTEAIYKNDDGIVLIDKDECIGCQECIEACPFGAMQFNEETDIAIKCDMCIDRDNNDGNTACSKACPNQCIFVGGSKKLSDKLVESNA